MCYASEQGVLNAQWNAAELMCRAAESQMMASTLFRPKVYIDGNQWCALYGENLQDGVSGFGASPAKAIAEFDKAWHTNLEE